MNRAKTYTQAFLFFGLLLLSCSLISGSDVHLKLDKAIPLPNIRGKIGRIAVNEDKQIAYLVIPGNNSIIAVDLQSGEITHTIKAGDGITELDDPQGIAYIPKNNSIVVTNAGDGKCIFYNAASYDEIQPLSLTYFADQVRYCPSLHKIFVGYGDGGISVIDADSFNILSHVALPAHPESFQVDEVQQKLFVNVPLVQKIFVIDLKTNSTVAEWVPEEVSNYSMALDTGHHRLFIICKKSSKLEIFDTENGKIVYSTSCSDEADDIYYISDRKEIYVTSGTGFIDVIKQKDANHYENVAKIPTRPGAHTSLFVPGMYELLVAVPAIAGKNAELQIYKPTAQSNLVKK